MSNIRDPETDQVAPTQNNKPAVWIEVIADMQQRNEHGTRKYGTPLQPHNGRNAMRDLYEELLDAAVYAKQKMMEDPDTLPGRLRDLIAEWRRVAVVAGGKSDTHSAILSSTLHAAANSIELCIDGF